MALLLFSVSWLVDDQLLPDRKVLNSHLIAYYAEASNADDDGDNMTAAVNEFIEDDQTEEDDTADATIPEFPIATIVLAIGIIATIAAIGRLRFT